MKKFLYMISASVLLISCVDKDIPPKNIINDDMLLDNTAGVEIYIADLYRHLPIEDFKYCYNEGLNFFGWLASLGNDGTGECVGRDYNQGFTGEAYQYWGAGYTLVHQCNNLIESLPKYKSLYSDDVFNDYLGQAYFVRAFVFYQMARRYGGIPLVTETIQYSSDKTSDQIEKYRSSEEDTWNRILEDFQTAADLLPEQSYLEDSANKYVALGLRAEAALYAGSIAKYNMYTDSNNLSYIGRKSKNRVMGFDPGRENELSVKWFSEAYKSAREVMKSGKYSLYKKLWVAGHDDSARYAQYRNMVKMLTDDSPENIWVRRYSFPQIGHCLDSQSSPFYYRGSGSAMSCNSLVTLDFIEQFEFFKDATMSEELRYPDGRLKLTTGDDYAEGDYLMWDTPEQLYKYVEPRLRSYCIFPFEEFRSDHTVGVRLGVYTGEVPVKPFWDKYDYDSYATHIFESLDIFTGQNGVKKTLYMSTDNMTQTETVEVAPSWPCKHIDTYSEDGGETYKIAATASDGPFYGLAQTCATGVYMRKYLDETLTRNDIHDGYSDQPFILYRYAETMLTVAEAAVELAIAGADCPIKGDDMLAIATDNIRQIQERAGVVNILDHQLTGCDEDRNIVRKERRKELPMEHKTKWDLRRWRVLHSDNRTLFWGTEQTTDQLKKWSLNDTYRFRAILPIYSPIADKYFFDASMINIISGSFTYTYNSYYFPVPGGEVAISNYIDQNPIHE